MKLCSESAWNNWESISGTNSDVVSNLVELHNIFVKIRELLKR